MQRTFVLLALFANTAAFAGDPEPAVKVNDDGTVVGRMVLDAPEDAVRQALHEVQLTRVGSSVIELKFTRDGSCHAIFRRTRGLFSPLEMRTRLCPTAHGWRESLVESSDFDAYEIEWKVDPNASGGVGLSLSVRSDVNLMVPTSLMRQSQMKGVRESFAAVLGRLLKIKPKE
jgi:hypothetical protein